MLGAQATPSVLGAVLEGAGQNGCRREGDQSGPGDPQGKAEGPGTVFPLR